MRIRRITREVQTRLEAVARPEAAGGRGKIERKVFSNGEEELEAKVRLPKLSDQEVELRIGETVGIALRFEGGRGALQLRSAGDDVPQVQAGERASIRAGGVELLWGIFEED